MRSTTLKQIILTISVSIGIIMLLQLYWLNKQYSFEQREFTTNVVKAIRGFYEDFGNNSGPQMSKSVEYPNNNTFIIKMEDTIPPKNILVDSLRSELDQVNVYADCKIAFYSKDRNGYLFELYLPTLASREESISDAIDLPVIEKNYSYVLLYFPNRNKYILSQMFWLIASSIFLILLLTGLGTSLFYLYKQKFLVETQNDFIRNVTHEFQTPLATLSLGLDALAKSSIYEHPEKLERYRSLMHGQLNYLKQHINNLVRVIKTDSTGPGLRKERLLINKLIQDAIAQLHFALAEKKGTIDFKFEETGVTILGNEDNLFIALLNIISNAIKYSPQPHIVISTTIDNQSYAISIKDNGIGIDKKFQKSLFKKFYRVPTGDLHDVKGLGLGLYFVKKIIDYHHGKIIINSYKNVGTEFIIHLPLNE